MRAVFFDVEFLTDAGAPQRFWCGPDDPDPIAVQVGAVAISQKPPFDIEARFERVIRPVGRDGPAEIPEFFAKFTGLTQERVAQGVSLAEALTDLDTFADGARMWSWGKDEFNLVAISCYAAGIAAPIPVQRFGNATRLFLAAGVPPEELNGLRSPGLPAYLGIAPPAGTAHDAAHDAECVALSIQHLLRVGRLDPARLRPDAA